MNPPQTITLVCLAVTFACLVGSAINLARAEFYMKKADRLLREVRAATRTDNALQQRPEKSG